MRGLIVAFELLHSSFFSKSATRDSLKDVLLSLREQITTFTALLVYDSLT